MKRVYFFVSVFIFSFIVSMNILAHDEQIVSSDNQQNSSSDIQNSSLNNKTSHKGCPVSPLKDENSVLTQQKNSDDNQKRKDSVCLKNSLSCSFILGAESKRDLTELVGHSTEETPSSGNLAADLMKALNNNSSNRHEVTNRHDVTPINGVSYHEVTPIKNTLNYHEVTPIKNALGYHEVTPIGR